MVKTTDIMVEIEKKFDLMKFTIRDFNVWWMSRHKIYESIDVCMKNNKDVNNNSSSSMKKKMNNFKYVKNLRLKPNKYKSVDILCISSTNLRREKQNGKYFDIIFDYIGKYDGKHSYAILNTFSGVGYIENVYTDNCYNMSWLTLSVYLSRRYYNFILKKEEIKLIKNYFCKVENYLRDKYEIDVDIKSIVLQNTSVLIKHHKYALKILKRVNPKVLYVECAYSPTHLIFTYAAKALGIKVVEFQHGLISEQHLGYMYGDKRSLLEPIPDYLCVYGSYFQSIIKKMNPHRQLNIIEYGYPNLIEKFLINTNSIKAEKKYDFVITTQSVMYADYWCQLILHLLEKDKNIKILLKIHPNEIMNYREGYKKIMGNSRVYIAIKENIYQCLSLSHIHLSCYSTCHYEALVYNIPTIVMKFYGWWHVNSLKDYNVPFVECVEELMEVVKNQEYKNIKFDLFRNEFFNLDINNIGENSLVNKIEETNKLLVKK